jgi:hypothetical protein
VKRSDAKVGAPGVSTLRSLGTRLRRVIAGLREEGEAPPGESERLRITDVRAQAAAAPDSLRGGTGIAH